VVLEKKDFLNVEAYYLNFIFLKYLLFFLKIYFINTENGILMPFLGYTDKIGKQIAKLKGPFQFSLSWKL